MYLFTDRQTWADSCVCRVFLYWHDTERRTFCLCVCVSCWQKSARCVYWHTYKQLCTTLLTHKHLCTALLTHWQTPIYSIATASDKAEGKQHITWPEERQEQRRAVVNTQVRNGGRGSSQVFGRTLSESAYLDWEQLAWLSGLMPGLVVESSATTGSCSCAIDTAGPALYRRLHQEVQTPVCQPSHVLSL